MKDAETHFKSAFESVRNMRDNFAQMETTSVELASTRGIEPNFQK